MQVLFSKCFGEQSAENIFEKISSPVDVKSPFAIFSKFCSPSYINLLENHLWWKFEKKSDRHEYTIHIFISVNSISQKRLQFLFSRLFAEQYMENISAKKSSPADVKTPNTFFFTFCSPKYTPLLENNFVENFIENKNSPVDVKSPFAFF